MNIKTAAALMAAFFVSGCGGAAQNEQPGELLRPATFDAGRCAKETTSAAGDIMVAGSGQGVSVLTVGAGVALDVSGNGHKVCIAGNLVSLTISDGTGSSVWVSGQPGAISISGSGHNVYAWGAAGNVDMAGNGHDVYTDGAQMVTDDSQGSSVSAIADYKTVN